MTSEIVVRQLRRSDITESLVDEINTLLRQQHSHARRCDSGELKDDLNHSITVVALDGNQVVGTGTLAYSPLKTHIPSGIHNAVVKEGYDDCALRARIIAMLVHLRRGGNFIDINVLPDDPIINTLKELGFVKRKKVTYRLKT